MLDSRIAVPLALPLALSVPVKYITLLMRSSVSTEGAVDGAGGKEGTEDEDPMVI